MKKARISKIFMQLALAVGLIVPATASDDNFRIRQLHENYNHAERVTLVPSDTPVNAHDNTMQVYKELQLPNLPYFAPYHPTQGARDGGTGIISFPLLVRLPGTYCANLPESLKQTLAARKINPANVTVAVVTQDMPFVDTMPLCLRPHAALLPTAVDVPAKKYVADFKIRTGVFDSERANIRYQDCALNTLMSAHAIIHEHGGSNVLSPKNMEMVGVDHKHPGSFYTFTSHGGRAFVCLHVLLSDAQKDAFRDVAARFQGPECTRDFILRRLDLLSKRDEFKNCQGPARILALLQMPQALQPQIFKKAPECQELIPTLPKIVETLKPHLSAAEINAIPAGFNPRIYLTVYKKWVDANHKAFQMDKATAVTFFYAKWVLKNPNPTRILFSTSPEEVPDDFDAEQYLENYPHVGEEAKKELADPQEYAAAHYAHYSKHISSLSYK